MKRFAILLFSTLLLLLLGSYSQAGDKVGSPDEEEKVTIGGKRGTIVLTEGGKSDVSETEEKMPRAKPLSHVKMKKGQDTEEVYALIIRRAYETLSEYVRSSGHEIDFKLSGFETLTADEFDQIYYADTATLPNEMTITMDRRTIADEIKGMKTVKYTPRWEVLDQDWTSSSEGLKMLAITLREALEGEGTIETELLEAKAVTRFDVTTFFEGKARSYKSAFLWIPGEKQSEWRIRVVDHITQGVERVLLETIPPEGAPIPAPIAEKVEPTSQCYSDYDLDGANSTHYFGGNDHISGYHETYAEFIFSCSCDPNCQSRCIGSPGYTICRESTSGLTGKCHKMALDSAEGIAIRNNAITQGAQCAAGVVCAQKGCLFCICGLSVGVSVVGVNVTFSGSGDWTRRMSAVDTCFTCELAPPASPILVNLHGPYELTGLDQAVLFDIDADGEVNSVAWTDGAGDDAFLVLDRNGNGVIDDGTELFGSVTPQPVAEGEPNGFNALSVYDRPQNGGNSDGVIDASDWVYGELRLWLDSNHDAVSQPSELSDLGSMGVTELELDYVVSERRDRHGNKFRWQSRVRTAQGRTGHAADVIFLIQKYEP